MNENFPGQGDITIYTSRFNSERYFVNVGQRNPCERFDTKRWEMRRRVAPRRGAQKVSEPTEVGFETGKGGIASTAFYHRSKVQVSVRRIASRGRGKTSPIPVFLSISRQLEILEKLVVDRSDLFLAKRASFPLLRFSRDKSFDHNQREREKAFVYESRLSVLH